jgi:hypothetical protein
MTRPRGSRSASTTVTHGLTWARLSTTNGRLEGRLLAVVREPADSRDIAWHPI